MFTQPPVCLLLRLSVMSKPSENPQSSIVLLFIQASLLLFSRPWSQQSCSVEFFLENKTKVYIWCFSQQHYWQNMIMDSSYEHLKSWFLNILDHAVSRLMFISKFSCVNLLSHHPHWIIMLLRAPLPQTVAQSDNIKPSAWNFAQVITQLQSITCQICPSLSQNTFFGKWT